MPPVGFRKRTRSESPVDSPVAKKRKPTSSRPTSKKTLFESIDAPSNITESYEEDRKFLARLNEDDEDSALSEADSDEFEDVPAAKRQKTSHGEGEPAEESEEDEMDWEDAVQAGPSSYATPGTAKYEDDIGDVSISLNEDGSYIEPLVSAATGKKGPSKRERQIRVQTHCLHVMSLMWHNTVRNSWLNDKEVQRILVDALPPKIKQAVQKWRHTVEALNKGTRPMAAVTNLPLDNSKSKAKRGKKAEGRDWNRAAEPQEPDSLQATNSLLRLLKELTHYWRKRFTVTAPSIRKQGYKDLRRLRNDIKAWEKNKNNAEEHGERLDNIRDFRKRAKGHEGSRDVGAQLFVALLRGLGLEVRLVVNLQPAGFGWSKAEEAAPPKAKKKAEQPEEEIESDSDVEVTIASPFSSTKPKSEKKKTKASITTEKPTRQSSRGNKAQQPINLDDSDSSLSDAPSASGDEPDAAEADDNLSVIDVTPSIPKKKPHKKYDRDLAFPVYWAEVCDPVSHRVFPVDAVVLSTIASSDELLQTFEPRGKKAGMSKQVICYTIAYSADGTAKDVTVRYLKRHQLPGKTKGVRMPVEKVPIYNYRGKIKRWEDYDWFRNLMSLYEKRGSKRTAVDVLEDQTDLKLFKPAKEEKHVEKESLQGYKQSADFVLEQHLRREEALLPGARPVKTFTAGKGDKAVEHPVYRRSDIVACKTVESWHKEGRAIKVGEQPMKYVPMRAVTLIRKREIEDAQRETGEKLKQGLYAESQTEWIIPPPIVDGVIPKNAFGNMDVYVPTMVPKGAVHLPLRGTAKICRKLGIDHAEACTGFEFGKQRAVPVLTGVVVAKENEQLVRDAWKVEKEEQRRKEDVKRTATALHWWRKMVLGVRVLERMRRDYADVGGTEEEVNPFVRKARREGREHGAKPAKGIEEAIGRGFIASGDEEDLSQPNGHGGHDEHDHGGGFLLDDGDQRGDDGGGFMVEDDGEALESAPAKSLAPITPVSLQSLHKPEDAISEEDEDGGGEGVAGAATKTSTRKEKRPQAKAKSKQKARPARRKTIAVSDEDSLLSELESGTDDDDDDEDTAAPGLSSPQVIISPRKKATPVNDRKRASTSRAAVKATPTRSPYFDHNDEQEEEDEDEESEHEVTKPRQTTARTRGRH